MNSTLLHNLLNYYNGGGIPVSIEVSPPVSHAEKRRLLQSIDSVYAQCPVQFCAVTWHLRQFSADYGMNPEALKLAHFLQLKNKEVLLHIAAKGLSTKNVLRILYELHSLNINNIFALRGDAIENTFQDFSYAEDLVKFIRKHTSGKIALCVAGYPKGHPEGLSYGKDLYFLRRKVNAGANFIITQIILEGEEYISFVQDCRDFGISVPILAGIMPIQDYNSFQRMSTLCHLQVPNYIETILKSIKDNPETVKRFGIYHAVVMIKHILSSKHSQGLHFFTLNRTPAVLEVLKYTGLSITSPLRYLLIPLKEADSQIIVTKSSPSEDNKYGTQKRRY